MQPLRTYHGPSHSLFIEMVMVCVVLFQWQYQSLNTTMGFCIQVSGVNLGVNSHYNVGQFVSPDSHPAHFKGVVVLCKSTIPCCLNAFMVMSPHHPMAFADPFQLNFSPGAAFAEPTGSSYLLLGGSYSHFVSEQVKQSVEAVCISELATSSLGKCESDEAGSLILLELPAAVPSSGSAVALVGCEGDWKVPALIVQSWVQPLVPFQACPCCLMQSCIHS